MLKKNNDFIIFGKITKPHGLKGELRLLPFFEDTSFFHSAIGFVLFQNNEILGKFKTTDVRPHSKFLLIKVDGVDTLEKAQPFINGEIGLDATDVPDLDSDEFYIEDLVGMKVIDTDNKPIGSLTDVYESPSNDVFEITTLDREELLIPGIKDYIKNIDFDKRIITIVVPSYQ